MGTPSRTIHGACGSTEGLPSIVALADTLGAGVTGLAADLGWIALVCLTARVLAQALLLRPG